jgi:hypothetical protein
MTELDQLQDDVRCLMRARDLCNGGGAFEEISERIDEAKARIAVLEAEQADPWRAPKALFRIWERFRDRVTPQTLLGVLDYVRHIETLNADRERAIVRLTDELERAKREKAFLQEEAKDRAKERDEAEARVKELEARPVPPLDKRRVMATFFEISFDDRYVPNAEPYPLAEPGK